MMRGGGAGIRKDKEVEVETQLFGGKKVERKSKAEEMERRVRERRRGG